MKQMDDPAEEMLLKSEKGQEEALCNSLREKYVVGRDLQG